MHFRLVLALLAAVTFCSTGFAQSGVVKGVVKDAYSKEPLVGAYVLYGDGKGTTVDFDGNYYLDLPFGSYTLKVTYIGYKAINKEITVDRAVTQLNFLMETEMMNEVEVVADVARERETPVAFSNVLPAKIQEELGSQDIPMILNSTPGVYATQQGGGDGDARITIRGFNQRNVAVMLDGVPVNDMENGWVYWSNWFGLDAVTRSIQVQRGLGASKIAIPAVGGTMNIITKGIDARKGVTLKQEVANDAFLRTTIGITTGRLKNGWGLTLAGSFKQGDGWVDQNFTKGYFYYVKIEKQLGKHLLSLSGMGAPQQHGQRSFMRPIASWDHETARNLGVSEELLDFYKERGLRYNMHWGTYEQRNYLPNDAPASSPYDYAPGEIVTVNERVNFYHKPQFSLRDFWAVNEKLYISNILYLSVGRGGGTGLLSVPDAETALTPNGQLDFQNIYNDNMLLEFAPGGLNLDENGEVKSSNILRASYNNHFWYGLLSSATYKYNENWTLSAGVDFRSYAGEHFREVYDLIGGDYFVDNGDNENILASTKMRVGDKIDYHDVGYVRWGGGFAQAEYSKGQWTAFVNLSGAFSFYKGRDYFRKRVLELPDTTLAIGYLTSIDYNGTTYDRNSEGLEVYETEWVQLGGFTAKGGANYNLNEFMNVFANIGYLSRAPRFDNVITINNEVSENYANEIINGYEFGWSYARQKVATNLNFYYTKWNNRPVNARLRVPNPLEAGEDAFVFIPDMDALHLGVEWDAAYVISPSFTLEGLASIGDWTWQSEESGNLESNNGQLVIDPSTQEPYTLSFDPQGVHVGDAAQVQLGGSVRYEYKKNFYLSVRSTYFDKFYANFNPESLVGVNAGRESWQVPAYHLLDLHSGYRYRIKDVVLNLRLSVFNVLNAVYISDAQNNDSFASIPLSNFDASSATVFFGQGRRFNVSLTANF